MVPVACKSTHALFSMPVSLGKSIAQLTTISNWIRPCVCLYRGRNKRHTIECLSDS